MIRPVSPKVSSWGKIHGGKFRYCRDYLRLFDAAGCDFYAESYYGGGGVHMNIPNGIFKREYINDIGHIHRTLSALKNPRHSDAVVHLLRDTEYSRESFDDSLPFIGDSDPAVHAAAYIVRNRMSRSGLFEDFGWSDRLRGKNGPKGLQPGDKNAWEEFAHNPGSKSIARTIERLQRPSVRLYGFAGAAARTDGMDGIEHVAYVLDEAASAGAKALFFLDPPYMKETRVSVDSYHYEVDDAHHRRLLKAITSRKAKKYGRFYICGYFTHLYSSILEVENGWRLHKFDRKADSGQGKTKTSRVECLWESP